MHPTVRRELVKARQHDELRSAANRRLVAEAKQVREASGGPAAGPTLSALAARPVRIPQLRKLLARLLPA